jgi:dTDP-glucose 4,6-dehydratase
LNLTDRVVLVTGAGGFIGSHLTERLLAEGAQVRALVHYNALGSRGWLDTTPDHPALTVIAGDIADRGSVAQAVGEAEIIFHLAALIGIPYSYHAPESYVRTNIIGTLNVLQVAQERGVERVFHTSTSEVYGTARYAPIDESHPLQGQSPYSATKIGADKLVESFYLSFGLPVITIRPFNTFGPRQSTRAVIPTIISQCLAGKQRIQLGALTPTRDLNYVSNTVEGYLAAAQAPDVMGETFNLGSEREISIGDLASLIARLCGVEVIVESEAERLRPAGSEVERLLAESAKARRLLDWEPRLTLEEGLGLTIEWIRQNIGRYRTDEYVV